MNLRNQICLLPICSPSRFEVPVTVIFRYLACVSLKVYFSGAFVTVLIPEKIFVNMLPSCELEISNVYCLSFPLYHDISAEQIFFTLPRNQVVSMNQILDLTICYWDYYQ